MTVDSPSNLAHVRIVRGMSRLPRTVGAQNTSGKMTAEIKGFGHMTRRTSDNTMSFNRFLYARCMNAKPVCTLIFHFRNTSQRSSAPSALASSSFQIS
jgi:hypothetical protein